MNYDNGYEYVAKIRERFYAIIALPLLAFFALYFVYYKKLMAPLVADETALLIMKLALASMFVGAAIAYYFFFQQLKPVKELPTLREKLDGLMAVSIKKFIILSITTAVVVSFYALTGTKIMAGLCVLMVVALGMSHPHLLTVFGDLKLKKAERNIFKNNEQID